MNASGCADGVTGCGDLDRDLHPSSRLGDSARLRCAVLADGCADLERRRSNGADAPPSGKPASRKAKRGEQVVICSIPEHRTVLADCLEDAFVAFTSTSAEAKAAQAAFKAKVARPNRATGSANAVEE